MKGFADLLGALVVMIATAIGLVVQAVGRRDRGVVAPQLLVLDNAYSLEEIRERGLEPSLTSRSLDGFFGHVWHVHPLVDERLPPGRHPHGRARFTDLQDGHTVIEAATCISPRLHAWPMLSLALAQASLMIELGRVIGAGAVRVVRAGDPFYLGAIALVLARLHGISLALRINGNHDALYQASGQLAYPRLFKHYGVERRIARFVLRRADLVAGSNHDNAGYALANGARPDRTTVFPYGVLIDPVHRTDPAGRPPPPADLLGKTGDYLAAVTRLEPVKRCRDLLEVMAVLREKTSVALVVMGEGSQRREMEAQAARLGLSERVRLVGNCSQEVIARVLAHAKVVLAPMAGRALVEAALSGRPVVAYDVDWHGELITNGENGVLVAPGDIRAMAEAVEDLLGDPRRATRMGATARAHALQSMDPEVLCQRERHAYEELLQRVPPSSRRRGR